MIGSKLWHYYSMHFCCHSQQFLQMFSLNSRPVCASCLLAGWRGMYRACFWRVAVVRVRVCCWSGESIYPFYRLILRKSLSLFWHTTCTYHGTLVKAQIVMKTYHNLNNHIFGRNPMRHVWVKNMYTLHLAKGMGWNLPIYPDSLNYFMIPESMATSTKRVEALWTFES